MNVWVVINFLKIEIAVDFLMAACNVNEFQRVGPATQNALEPFFVFIQKKDRGKMAIFFVDIHIHLEGIRFYMN